VLRQLHSNGTRDIITFRGDINNTFPFTVSLPRSVPFPHPVLCRLAFPLPVRSRLPFPLSIHYSLPFPGPFLTALCVLLILALVIVIAIARTAPSTTRSTGCRPGIIIIILVDYLIPIQLSDRPEVAWVQLLTAWRLNHCTEIIPIVPREKLTGVYNLALPGCLRIGAIDLIPEGTGIVPPPIVYLVMGLVKYLPQI
jgi:hypothetical protein